MAGEEKAAHSVIVPLVIATQEDGSALYLYEGMPVPSTVSSDEVKRLLAGEFIAKVKAPKASESEQSPEQRYNASTIPDLKSEIEKRNEGREDDAKVSAEGNKPDLIAALLADDAKQAEQQ